MSLLRRRIGAESSRPGQSGIDVSVDPDVDAARIVVSDEAIEETVRVEGLGFVDLDKAGNIVAIEIFKASTALARLEEMERERHGKPNMVEDLLRAAAPRFVNEAKERVKAP